MDRALKDRILLDDLVTAYAVAIDTDQVTALADIAHDDAVFDYTSSGGPRGSVPVVQEWLAGALALVPQRAHLIVNRRFTVDGDEATVEAHFFNPMSVRIPGRNGTLWNPGGGYYTIAFRRQGDSWLISELVMWETWRVAVHVQEAGGRA